MILGRQVLTTRSGGTIEIYEDDKFIGNLEYRAAPPVGYINFTPKSGPTGEMEVDIGWWLTKTLDYRKEEVERFIRGCLSFSATPCPMTP